MLMMMNSMLMLIFSLLNFIIWLNFSMFNKMLMFEWTIFNMNSIKFNMIILIYEISLLFMMMVALISSMIMMYSLEYMSMNYFLLNQFYYLLLMFVISMMLMIMSPSILSILLGWDGLGLISYCLVIYYQNFKVYTSGLITIILNRIGDYSLLMIIGLSFITSGFNMFFYKMDMIMLFLLLIMSMTKTAQLPFSSWLPAAMMAPTSISSFVHSSTLVTAGVYMLIRYNYLLNYKINFILLFLSSLTMLFVGMLANFEFNFKKIIAFSTLSQLGFMMSILSFNNINLTFLHLIIHAMFKSLMFLCAGSFIHYMNNSQDLRNYSGMLFIYPFKSLIFIFSSLCYCGFPFLAKFFSKDFIIEFFLINKMNLFCLINLMLGTIFTVSYSIRIFITLFSNYFPKFNNLYIKENKLMNLYMFMMMMITILMSKFYINTKFLFLNFSLSLNMKLMIMKLCLLGMFFSMMFMKTKSKNLYLFMKNMMLLNNFYKISYVNILNKSFKHDLYFNKSIYLIFNINLKNYFNNLFMYLKVNNFLMYNFLNYYFFLILFLFMIM